MGFIRLRTEHADPLGPPIRYRDEQGRERVVPLLRLRTHIWIGKELSPPSGGERRTYNGILDTGAPLTVIPKRFWQEFAARIARLQLIGDQPPIGRAGGRQFTYFLGRIWMGVIDTFGRRLPAVPVLAQFREDDIPAEQPQPPLLLGLVGGILEGRHLTRWPTSERFDPDIPTLESHGQWWNLAEP